MLEEIESSATRVAALQEVDILPPLRNLKRSVVGSADEDIAGMDDDPVWA